MEPLEERDQTELTERVYRMFPEDEIRAVSRGEGPTVNSVQRSGGAIAPGRELPGPACGARQSPHALARAACRDRRVHWRRPASGCSLSATSLRNGTRYRPACETPCRFAFRRVESPRHWKKPDLKTASVKRLAPTCRPRCPAAEIASAYRIHPRPHPEHDSEPQVLVRSFPRASAGSWVPAFRRWASSPRISVRRASPAPAGFLCARPDLAPTGFAGTSRPASGLVRFDASTGIGAGIAPWREEWAAEPFHIKPCHPLHNRHRVSGGVLLFPDTGFAGSLLWPSHITPTRSPCQDRSPAGRSGTLVV